MVYESTVRSIAMVPLAGIRIETVQQLELVDPDRPLGKREQAAVDTHKPLIAAALGDLEDGLKKLAVALQDAKFAVVFEPVRDEVGEEITAYRELKHGPSLEAAVTAYCTIELKPDDPVNAPVRCHGVVGVDDPRIIELARSVNRLKSRLKATFQPLTNARVNAAIKQRRNTVVTKIPLALFILRQLQKSSLNRLGAYREIPLIRTGKEEGAHPPTPIAIRFTEAWTRSVAKRTIGDLLTEAKANERPDHVQQLLKCDIDRDEYVYWQKSPYLRMRANLWFPGTGEAAKPKNYMGEMPILFLLKHRQLPTVTAPRARSRSPELAQKRPAKPLVDTPIFPGSLYKRRQCPKDRERASE